MKKIFTAVTNVIVTACTTVESIVSGMGVYATEFEEDAKFDAQKSQATRTKELLEFTKSLEE